MHCMEIIKAKLKAKKKKKKATVKIKSQNSGHLVKNVANKLHRNTNLNIILQFTLYIFGVCILLFSAN
jgi:hypothetical protein